MKKLIFAAFAASIVLAGATPARAAYCGAAADTKAVQKLAIKTFGHKIDKTYILNLDVAGNWARADISYAGEAFLYFNKVSGAWAFKGNFPPKNMPAATSKLFDARQYPRCKNPAFISRGSG